MENEVTFLHVPEWRVAEAVGAQGVALAPGPWGPQHQLKVVQRTAELLVQLDGSILGKTVGLVTVGAVESAGLGLRKLTSGLSSHASSASSKARTSLVMWLLTNGKRSLLMCWSCATLTLTPTYTQQLSLSSFTWKLVCKQTICCKVGCLSKMFSTFFMIRLISKLIYQVSVLFLKWLQFQNHWWLLPQEGVKVHASWCMQGV